MRKTETFKRGETNNGITPLWLARLRELNAEAKGKGKLQPFGGTPKLSQNVVTGTCIEEYAAGGRVEITGVAGKGTVILSWDE